MNFISQIQQQAKQSESKKILFPEGEDPRVIEAVACLRKEDLVIPAILGKESVINQIAQKNNIDLTGIDIIDPVKQNNQEFVNQYYELRKHKGIREPEAFEIMQNPLFYAAMMIKNNQADGALAGAVNTTGDVLRAAIQIVGLAKNRSTVSSSFFMVLQDGAVLSFGDCAVIPDPDVE